MYANYWKLQREPFENSLDPQFFFPSQTHQAALLKLRYLLENRKGAGLLVGPTGSGKTFVLERLAHEMGEGFGPWIHIRFPQMSSDDLLASLAVQLVGHTAAIGESLPRHRSLRLIEQSLRDHTQQNRQPVIVIDDAHLIDDTQALQAIELLLNWHSPPQSVFSLILLGDCLLLPRIGRMPRFDDRVAIRSMLQPLSADEVASYVRFRLEMSGIRQAPFDDAALREIAKLSAGIPRRINRVADLALLIGYADNRQSLTSADVEAVSEELATVGVD